MKRLCTAIVVVVSLLMAAPAQANPGLRLGVTDDPDTLFLGFFYEAPVTRAGRSFFALEPGIDLGFDSDVDFFTIRGTLNGKFLFRAGRRFFLYPLVGLSIYYINVDCPFEDCDDTSAGLNLGFGMRIERFNVELSLGLDDDDLPDFTASFGFLF